MKYYKYQDNDGPLGEAVTYIEVNDGWAIRQITFNGREYHASNVKNPPWGPILADQQVNYDIEEEGAEVIPINKNEFDKIWFAHLANHEAKWRETKGIFLIGQTVSGYIEIFYPQGVIINLENDALGVADYQACRASTEWQFMYPGHKVTALVAGYDKENQWVVLTSPQVHKERRTT